MENQKRKRSLCHICNGDHGWTALKWKTGIEQFQLLGETTLSSQQYRRVLHEGSLPHFTPEQLLSLLGLFWKDGWFHICLEHFREMTNHGSTARKRIISMAKSIDPDLYFLDPSLLVDHHTGKIGNHRIPAMNELLKSFIHLCFFYHPKDESICFNADVASWRKVFQQWNIFYEEMMNEKNPIQSRTTLQKYLEAQYPQYSFGGHLHESDACDECENYCLVKRKFTRSYHLSLRDPGKTQEEINGMKQDFLSLHQQWDSHLSFAHGERSWYSSKVQEAKEISDILHLSIDAMQVQTLPYVGYSNEPHSFFFLKKMKGYLLGVFNEGTGVGNGYCWDQTFGSTSTNHVLTCLFHHILLFGKQEETLRITMDNCSVNKSYLFIAFSTCLVILCYFKRVSIDFLVSFPSPSPHATPLSSQRHKHPHLPNLFQVFPPLSFPLHPPVP